jgi:hypothetical protein
MERMWNAFPMSYDYWTFTAQKMIFGFWLAAAMPSKTGLKRIHGPQVGDQKSIITAGYSLIRS